MEDRFYNLKSNLKPMENSAQNLITILNSGDLEHLKSSLSHIELMINKLMEDSKEQVCTKYLSSDEVCEMLQISSRTLQKYRDEGRIRFAKLDRKIIYKLIDVEAFVEANMIDTEI
jgi:excisionase family DNA binding protein